MATATVAEGHQRCSSPVKASGRRSVLPLFAQLLHWSSEALLSPASAACSVRLHGDSEARASFVCLSAIATFLLEIPLAARRSARRYRWCTWPRARFHQQCTLAGLAQPASAVSATLAMDSSRAS